MKFIQFALFPLACFPFQAYSVFGTVKKEKKISGSEIVMFD